VRTERQEAEHGLTARQAIRGALEELRLPQRTLPSDAQRTKDVVVFTAFGVASQGVDC
jgi:hypothetical protein